MLSRIPLSFAFFIPFFLNTAHAGPPCPMLTGDYEFESPSASKLIVTQHACDAITISFVDNKYTATLIVDGKPYEKLWDEKMNSKSSKPATEESYSFDVATYSGPRLVWQTNDGLKSECDGKYSFTSFECKLFEHSFGWNKELNSYTWTQIAWWRSYDGSYAKDEFRLRKIR